MALPLLFPKVASFNSVACELKTSGLLRFYTASHINQPRTYISRRLVFAIYLHVRTRVDASDMVTIQDTGSYLYTSLVHTNSIRLLRLQPNDSSDAPFSGELIEARLNDELEFEALSYAWEDNANHGLFSWMALSFRSLRLSYLRPTFSGFQTDQEKYG